MAEQWRAIVGYEGLYEVSSLGYVRSVCRQGTAGGPVAQFPNHKGYLRVSLSKQGRVKSFAVHRLVGDAFLPPCPKGQETRHGPRGIQCNAVDNLSYGTPIENAADKKRDGTHREGSAIYRARLTEESVYACRVRYAEGGITIIELAERHGVAMQTMHDALVGKTWKHVPEVEIYNG